MEIVFAGCGPVGQRCRSILNSNGIKHTRIEDWVPRVMGDLLLSVHWPTIFTSKTLKQFTLGALNLHNSYLPWNRGAHTCTWAIVDGTPHGATLHWLDDGIDTGDIFYQEQIPILPEDTADSLYKRTADLEVEVFRVGISHFLEGDRTRIPQQGRGSFHRKRDLEFLKRGLTTSDMEVVCRTTKS